MYYCWYISIIYVLGAGATLPEQFGGVRQEHEKGLC